ncbi:DNA topoisomerase IB [Aminobacter sp. AP02]|uniref:DNA topoisomerase IB n=1 Tax=Aminobacter sp. AP02 TaxID=2135737 RepID=UPI000D6BB702|nr:DNA topoisomerase IB [Aminobacter sp. AP02]PWK69936.1 DNA topoisomerase-1 [Aminobacter sp. AP02]
MLNNGDPAKAALSASLNYVTDSEPGVLRRKTGRSFRYTSNGKAVNRTTLGRIKSLAIPPAWTDVWICPDPDGHIQATGRDLRGRKQYLYHAEWSQSRGEAKFSGLVEFARALPYLRKQVEHDLRLRGPVRERVLALAVWLLDQTMIRVGSSTYAKANKSYGLTTLRNRHVEIAGSTIRFAFKGKSGKEWKLSIVDRRMARVIRSLQDIPGQMLFQYLDDQGGRASVTSNDVNSYIREASKGEFTSKDFRTWGGTVRALTLFAARDVPATDRAIRRACNEVIDQVAARLGNTRTVCRQGYIHPGIVEAWTKGRLSADIAAMGRPPRALRLDPQERLTIAWLQRCA